MLGTQAEHLLVPKLAGVADFGHFTAGTMLVRRMEIVPDGLSSTFYPVVAKGHAQGRKEAQAAVRRYALFSLAACVPAALLLALVAEPIALLLFKEQAAAT